MKILLVNVFVFLLQSIVLLLFYFAGSKNVFRARPLDGGLPAGLRVPARRPDRVLGHPFPGPRGAPDLR